MRFIFKDYYTFKDEELLEKIAQLTDGTSYAFLSGVYSRVMFSCIKDDTVKVGASDIIDVLQSEIEYIKNVNKNHRGIAGIMDECRKKWSDLAAPSFRDDETDEEW